MSGRVHDYALLVGHVWRCTACRGSLLNEPEKAWIGCKLSDDQRQHILDLTDDSFSTVMELSDATGLSVRELEEAIDHPRARLRHLGVVRGDYRATGSQ